MCSFLLCSKAIQLYIYIFFHILLYYGLSQNIEYPVLYSRTSLLIHSIFFYFFFVFLLLLLLLFLGPLPRHMEVPRLGVELELQPPAFARATAVQDPSRVCNLHHSSRQRRIVNPLSKGRDRTRNLMVPSRIR